MRSIVSLYKNPQLFFYGGSCLLTNYQLKYCIKVRHKLKSF